MVCGKRPKPVSDYDLYFHKIWCIPYGCVYVKRQFIPHKHWHSSPHWQQQDTSISVCCNQWTNKDACISEVLHKRHQLKAWFIISSMPLLPIKDRDGDKEAFTAGGQQTDKTNMVTQSSVSKSPGSTTCSSSSQVLLKDPSKAAKFYSHYVHIIHWWQEYVGNPILTLLWAFWFMLNGAGGGQCEG